jgi:hypothetical protein
MLRPRISLLLTLLDDAYYLPEWAECARRIAPDEVLVVDGGSEDGGPEFLREQRLPGFRLVVRPMEEFRWDRSKQFNFAADQARFDWILMLDADEVLWPPRRDLVDLAIVRGGADIVSLWFARFHLWPNDSCRLDLANDLDTQGRLWKRSVGIRMVRRCHTRQVVGDRVISLESPESELLQSPVILHRKLTAPFDVQFDRHKRWMEHWAEDSAAAGHPVPEQMLIEHGPVLPLPGDVKNWREELLHRLSPRAEQTSNSKSPLLEKVVDVRQKAVRSHNAQKAVRGRRIAVSLVGIYLGDRLILEAPLRLHRRNQPDDHFIAIVDRCDGVDFPHTVARHFDEIWWVSNEMETKWNAVPESPLAWVVRDNLVSDHVGKVFTPWQPGQFPCDAGYSLLCHDCFAEGNYLKKLRFYPRVAVPVHERRWAEDFRRHVIGDDHDGLVAVHARNIQWHSEKNPDPALIRRIVDWLRTQGRFRFLLFGRDDAPQDISGPDVLSLVGQNWHFDRTAALMAHACLFIGGDSGLTHAAAGLDVPIIGLAYVYQHGLPFTTPSRYTCFKKGDGPETIMAEVKRFVGRLGHISTGRKSYGKRKIAKGA